MPVSVYFHDARATIPRGATFEESVDFPNRVRVLDEEGKVIAVVSVAAMQMIEIDAEEDDEDGSDEKAAASPA